MADVPIIRVGNTLIATLHQDLTDIEALAFQDALNAKLEESGAVGVLVDASLVRIIDSFLGRLLHETAVGARLLGADIVVAGIQPAVATTLVELGFALEGIHTTLTADRGLRFLRERARTAGSMGGRGD